MRVGERIAKRRGELGLSQTQLARTAEVSQGTIAKLEAGISSGSSQLHKIARALQTTAEYLTGETDDPGKGYVPVPSTESVASELGLVPVREIDLSLGMGSTYLDVPVTETIRHFPIEWLRLYTRAAPEQLFFAQGAGDSMEPTLRDSDLLLIDCSQQNLNISDKIWAITYAGLGAIKRLRALPNGGVEMMADNPHVSNATAYDDEMHILGRVVATVRKM
ncbi:XRE family transcriptional regulator [Novosphingobium pentaromativorans]|uniref:XRE family transcriptional regulator n=1 Tax=Novosphingobium pentaromativorans TaxID=205844 RepID=UPI00068A7D02|nr:S24 family peptidase [Novosphingobium pentaromativorans]